MEASHVTALFGPSGAEQLSFPELLFDEQLKAIGHIMSKTICVLHETFSHLVVLSGNVL